MKKLVLTVLTLPFFFSISNAQVDIGLKGGVNYNFGGDFKELFSDVGDNAINIVRTGADNKTGFHLGLWTRFHFAGLYLRPEISYTELNNAYDNKNVSINNINTKFSTKKLDIPILLGTKIIGPVHIYGGPSVQYILNSKFSADEITQIKTDDISIGLQLGTGIELGNFGIDVRWEKGFSNDLDGEFLNTDIKVDNRPNQIIFGLSYRLNNRK